MFMNVTPPSRNVSNVAAAVRPRKLPAKASRTGSVRAAGSRHRRRRISAPLASTHASRASRPGIPVSTAIRNQDECDVRPDSPRPSGTYGAIATMTWPSPQPRTGRCSIAVIDAFHSSMRTVRPLPPRSASRAGGAAAVGGEAAGAALAEGPGDGSALGDAWVAPAARAIEPAETALGAAPCGDGDGDGVVDGAADATGDGEAEGTAGGGADRSPLTLE